MKQKELRNYFAALAMQSYLVSEKNQTLPDQLIIDQSFKMADMMIKKMRENTI